MLEAVLTIILLPFAIGSIALMLGAVKAIRKLRKASRKQ